MNKRKVETLKGFLPEQEGILTRCFGLVVEGVLADRRCLVLFFRQNNCLIPDRSLVLGDFRLRRS